MARVKKQREAKFYVTSIRVDFENEEPKALAYIQFHNEDDSIETGAIAITLPKQQFRKLRSTTLKAVKLKATQMAKENKEKEDAKKDEIQRDHQGET